MEKNFLYGASGHAKVVLEVALDRGCLIEGMMDDDEHLWHQAFCGVPVLGGREALKDLPHSSAFLISIGCNKIRQSLDETLQELGFGYSTLAHSRSTVSPSAVIGAGTVVMAGAVLNAAAQVGAHCIVNTNASVDHDCVLGDFVHVAPGATLCGNVVIGEGTLVGAGSTIVPGVTIGRWATVGAGTVVLKDVPDGCTVVGNPGQIL